MEDVKKLLNTLYSITDYFTLGGSNVFVAALNSPKAFDKLNHFGLTSKTYQCQNSKLTWATVYCTRAFSYEITSKICCGTRLGRIFSTALSNLYIIDLIKSLHDDGHSCEIGSEYCGIINYVDDIVLISGSLVKMQFTLHILYN